MPRMDHYHHSSSSSSCSHPSKTTITTAEAAAARSIVIGSNDGGGDGGMCERKRLQKRIVCRYFHYDIAILLLVLLGYSCWTTTFPHTTTVAVVGVYGFPNVPVSQSPSKKKNHDNIAEISATRNTATSVTWYNNNRNRNRNSNSRTTSTRLYSSSSSKTDAKETTANQQQQNYQKTFRINLTTVTTNMQQKKKNLYNVVSSKYVPAKLITKRYFSTIYRTKHQQGLFSQNRAQEARNGSSNGNGNGLFGFFKTKNSKDNNQINKTSNNVAASVDTTEPSSSTTTTMEQGQIKPRKEEAITFSYDYDLLHIGSDPSPTPWRKTNAFNSTSTTTTTSSSNDTRNRRRHRQTGIILIHPIGVGIGKWYYQRLFRSLAARHDNSTLPVQRQQQQQQQQRGFVIVAPDLIGSGSAVKAAITTARVYKNGRRKSVTRLLQSNKNSNTQKEPLPLLNISDWTDQIVTLMAKLEQDGAVHNDNSNDYDDDYDSYEDNEEDNDAASSRSKVYPIDDWCIVANGGCSPIALQVAERFATGTAPFTKPVSQVILSSTPRLPFFFNVTSNHAKKVAKAYKRICGIPGNLFWWYACRNQGAFIQKFSEKNLIGNPDKTLGPYWRRNCYDTATYKDGQSRYATFAFLAGTLQDGCVSSFRALIDYNNKNTTNNNHRRIRLDTIRGGDPRQNRARSWFWQKRKQSKTAEAAATTTSTSTTNNETKEAESPSSSSPPRKTLRDFAEENGLGGKEYVIGGRISLAHEDPQGYGDALMEFLLSNDGYYHSDNNVDGGDSSIDFFDDTVGDWQ